MHFRAYRFLKWEASKPVITKQQCSYPGCRETKLRHMPSGVFCEYHYMHLPQCIFGSCMEPSLIGENGEIHGTCRFHSKYKIDLSLYREIQWQASPLIKNETTIGKGKLKSSKTIQCCHPNCTKIIGLRHTPIGIYCEDHYLSDPKCGYLGCREPCQVVTVGFRSDSHLVEWGNEGSVVEEQQAFKTKSRNNKKVRLKCPIHEVGFILSTMNEIEFYNASSLSA